MVYVKDLTILLNGRSLNDILIIDNKVKSYSGNLENGIPIKSYRGQPEDTSLISLAAYLLKLRDVEDVRKEILNDFCIFEITAIQKQTIALLNP